MKTYQKPAITLKDVPELCSGETWRIGSGENQVESKKATMEVEDDNNEKPWTDND